MIIALDFDETYTACPATWDLFIEAAKNNGHTVVICTFRPENQDNRDISHIADKHELAIVYTAGKQKASCLFADIWIDDQPHLIPTRTDLERMAIGCSVNGES